MFGHRDGESEKRVPEARRDRVHSPCVRVCVHAWAGTRRDAAIQKMYAPETWKHVPELSLSLMGDG